MSSFPHPPAQPSGDWTVSLPGDSSIGEALFYAKAFLPPVDPWESAPEAPAGTTVTVASTFIVAGTQIAGDGLSANLFFGIGFAEKMLFRITGTPPPASISIWRWFDWYVDIGIDGTYSAVAYAHSDVAAWTWYGPGDTTSDGLVVPADGAALYMTGGNITTATKLGAPIVNRHFETDYSMGSYRDYWTPSTTTIHHVQRFDDVDTHVLPLMPYRLP